nr:hypothetical protein [uncultured Cohaesibacter sp.]
MLRLIALSVIGFPHFFILRYTSPQVNKRFPVTTAAWARTPVASEAGRGWAGPKNSVTAAWAPFFS